MKILAPVATTFTFTRSEYMLALKRHYRSTLKVGRDIIAGLAAIAGGTYLFFTTEAGWLAWFLLIPGIVLLATVWYALYLLPALVYHSQPKLKDEYSLSFSDEGIDFRTKNIDSTLQWTIYQSWRSDDDFYILYPNKRDMSVIPRRALSKVDDSRLREFLTQKIGPPVA